MSRHNTWRLGYESRSSDRPSVQRARADFLLKLLDLKRDVIVKLFNNCQPHFRALLDANERPLVAASELIETNLPDNPILRQPQFIRKRALEKLIPSWQWLPTVSGGETLQHAQKTFALEHHLDNEWCLDAMLGFLLVVEQTTSLFENPFTDRDQHLLRQCWREMVTDCQLSANSKQYQTNILIEEAGAYSFNFRNNDLEFSVPGPFYKPWSTFKEEVYREFKQRREFNIKGARTELNKQLRDYLNRVTDLTAQLGLVQPSLQWAGPEHMEWLIHYQIPPFMTYLGIAKLYNKDESTVREGIADAARFIDLNLRPSKAGRPPGIKETVRVDGRSKSKHLRMRRNK